MLESSLLGRAQHKSKSINVEANLLDEWLADRRILEAKVRLRLTLAAGIFVFGAVLIPACLALLDGSMRRDAETQKRYDAIALQIKGLDAKGKEAVPVIEYRAMAGLEHKRNDIFLGELLLVFNAAPNKVALSKLKSEIMGGEQTILCSADAEDLLSGNNFVADASKGPEVEYAVLSSSHKSSALAKDGIGFDFNKKIRVGK